MYSQIHHLHKHAEKYDCNAYKCPPGFYQFNGHFDIQDESKGRMIPMGQKRDMGKHNKELKHQPLMPAPQPGQVMQSWAVQRSKGPVPGKA